MHIDIIIVYLFLFVIILGIKNVISMSKIKNIIETIKKFSENVIFFNEIELKPHSKFILVSFVILSFLFKFINRVKIIKLIMVKVVEGLIISL